MGRSCLKIGAYVQLKNYVASDGTIVSCHGKGNWAVAGDHNGTQSKHHSRGLKQWTFAARASDSEDGDGDEDDEEDGEEDGETGAPVPQSEEVHEQRRKDFVKFAKTQEGRVVRVIMHLFMFGKRLQLYRLCRLTYIYL
jgi:hypothetical protein